MGVVKEAGYYDKVYGKIEHYREDYHLSQQFAVWVVLRQLIRIIGDFPIVELGCGTGQLAHYLWDEGLKNYIGLDFSGEAIDIARKFSKQAFVQRDIRYGLIPFLKEREMLEAEKVIFIIAEVLEHLTCDREVIEELPVNKSYVLMSVPTFDDVSHIRHFKTAQEITDRYGDLIHFTWGTGIGFIMLTGGVRRNKGAKKQEQEFKISTKEQTNE